MKRTIVLIFLLLFFIFPVYATDVDDLSDAWIIKCNVDGAEVLIDGESMGIITDHELIVPCTSPYEVFMIVRGSGFEEIWQTIQPPMSGSAEIINVWIDDASVSEDIGSIKVDSTPRGAKVYYQEDYLGKGSYKLVGYTPIVIEYAERGWHRVYVWKEGYNTEFQKILVTSGKTPTDNWFDLVPGESEDPDLEPTPIPTPVITVAQTPEIIVVMTEEITPTVTENIELTETGFNIGPLFFIFIIIIGCAGSVFYIYRVSGIRF